MKAGDRYHIYYVNGKYEFHPLPPVFKSMSIVMNHYFGLHFKLKEKHGLELPEGYYNPIFDADEKAYRGAVRVKKIRGYVLELNIK
jgi:hypothetical protein